MDGPEDRPSFDIAIIGAGIAGVHVAIGLLKRNILFTIYEQSSGLTETGADIAATSFVVDSMAALHPRAPQHLFKVSNLMKAFNCVNGCSNEDPKLRPSDGLYDKVIHPFSRRTHRTKLVNEVIKTLPLESTELKKHLQIIPQEHIKLGKRIESIVDRGDYEKLLLQFADGTTAEADAGMVR